MAKLLPAGGDQQGRCATRAWPPFPDTVATGRGSADAIGDDQAERASGWGALDECAAVEGGQHREPVPAPSESSVLPLLLWPLAVISAIALLAIFLPHGWPMAWPLG